MSNPFGIPTQATDDAIKATTSPDESKIDSTVEGTSALARGREAAEQASRDAVQQGRQVAEQGRQAVQQAGEAIELAGAETSRFASTVVDRLRNNAELTADRGTTTIANEVVEKVAGIAAREVPGVYDLGGDTARVFASIKERIGLGEPEAPSARGVSVRLEGTTASIDVTIVIEFGYVIHSVTEKVRAKVIGSVEYMLGLEVTEVNITVDDVHLADGDGDAAEEPAEAA